MSSNLVVAYPNESLFDAMNKMITNNFSQLPVVDSPDHLIGLLTSDDLTVIQYHE